MSDQDDRFGRYWGYLVFSSPWTEPDVPESGRRYLSVHRVDYAMSFRPLLGTHEHPIPPEDLIYIEAEPASPHGCEMDATLLDAERIMQAFELPTLIQAEWQRLFDHSSRQNRQHQEQSERYARTAGKKDAE